MQEENIEVQVASLTRKIHPQDLGEETSKLENTLRQALEEAIAEERKRVRGLIEEIRGMREESNEALDYLQDRIEKDILSSLDKLTDKEI